MANNAHVLTGLPAILNHEYIKPGIDLKAITDRYVTGGNKPTKGPQEKFNDEMAKISQEFGISLDVLTPRRDSSSANSAAAVIVAPPVVPVAMPPADDTPANDIDTEEPAPVSPQWIKPTSTLGPDFQFDNGSSLREHTYEQERRGHINRVNAEMGAAVEVSLENEKREDIKHQMLEQIDALYDTLKEEGVDLSRISRPTAQSSYDDVNGVLKMLLYKNDRIRYCSFAEEFLLFGAYELEDLFNGKRTFFGKYRPDVTGWHNHVNVKLRRMRHDTSALVSDIMHDYQIGPAMRLLLELVPNFVMYSKMKKQQHGAPSLREDAITASERIRSLDQI